MDKPLTYILICVSFFVKFGRKVSYCEDVFFVTFRRNREYEKMKLSKCFTHCHLVIILLFGWPFMLLRMFCTLGVIGGQVRLVVRALLASRLASFFFLSSLVDGPALEG